jgi:hypothetical protein
LATAAYQVVLQLSVFMHKVKATIQQAQNNKSSTDLFKGESVNKIFEFVQASDIEDYIFYSRTPLIYIKLKCPIFSRLKLKG